MNKIRKKNNKITKWYILLFIGIILVTFFVPYLFYMKQEFDMNHILFFNIFLVMIVFIILFLICIHSELFFYNILALEKMISFFAIFTLSIFLSCTFFFLPVMSWVFIPMAILFLFFSNAFIALSATYCCLFITIFLTGASYVVQVLYMLSILISILVFRQIKNNKLYYLAACISISIHLALNFSYNILFLEGPLQSDVIIYSVLNFLINGITLLFVINLADVFVIRKNHTIYTQINDQDFVLMKELKEKKENLYLHAIHCAYFCDKIAPKLGLNTSLVKAGTYYKNIGKLEPEDKNESVQIKMKTHKFPKTLCALLEELNTFDESLILSKEACLIITSDQIITAIERIYVENTDAKLDIEKLVDAIAMNIFTSRRFKNSDFTFRDFEIVISFFKEEKLYYDFLR